MLTTIFNSVIILVGVIASGYVIRKSFRKPDVTSGPVMGGEQPGFQPPTNRGGTQQ